MSNSRLSLKKGGEMKKLFGLVLVTAYVLGGIGTVSAGKKNKGLPPSLDQYYQTDPPVYLTEMYKLGESMLGITVNILQHDMANATNSFKAFSQNYEHCAKMVPEWRKYYDRKLVKKIGHGLYKGDIEGVFEVIGEVGETCSECHVDTMSAVWNHYNWKDFKTVSMETLEGSLPWNVAKMKYLLTGFDGIGVNIQEKDEDGAKQSFDLFKMMFASMTKACDSCHTSEPRYYVSDDIQTLIGDMGLEIKDGNLKNADNIRREIGKSCYRCHVLHMPAQYAKQDRGKAQRPGKKND